MQLCVEVDESVEGLEIIRYAPPYQVGRVTWAGRRGRQIYQFAGVEVSSSYGISCLLVYDAESNTCDVVKEPPGSLTITLANGKGEPLAGGAFEVRADTDGDGILGLADALLPDGACEIRVPSGSYVLVQTSAPGGLEGIAPVAFGVSGGQIAAVGVVNYPPAMPAAPAPVAYEPAPTMPEPVGGVSEPEVSLPEAVGGTVVRVIRAPGDAVRLLARDPVQAVAWIASIALFGLVVLAVRRRQAAQGLMG